MNEDSHKITGLTKDCGFQVGARKVFSTSPAAAWAYLFSKQGLLKWLGNTTFMAWENQRTFTTETGLKISVTTFKDNSHLRMKWQPKNWNNESMLQIRVIPTKEKATISFHHDKLTSSEQRQTMKTHWKAVLNQFETDIYT